MLASIVEQSTLFGSHNFAGTDMNSYSPTPSSPVVRHHRFNNNTISEEDNPVYHATSCSQEELQAPNMRVQGSLGSHDSDGAFPQQPPSFGLSLADPNAPNTGLPGPVRIIPAVVDSADLRYLPPNASSGGGTSSISDVLSSTDEATSDIGEAMSPIIQNNPVRPTTTLKHVRSEAAPGGLVEMSNISRMRLSNPNASMYQGFPHAASRSLFESNLTARRSALRGASSRENLPSVLLSILKQENIDYENDFYWLAQFHADRRRDPAGLERSIIVSPGPRLRRAFSGGGAVGGGNSIILGGMMSPITRQSSQTSPPPFATHPDAAAFAPGLVDSGMESPRPAGAFCAPTPPSQDHQSDSQAAFIPRPFPVPSHEDSFAGQTAPHALYGYSTTSTASERGSWGGAPTNTMSMPLSNGSNTSTGSQQFRTRSHGPSAAQKRSVSGLDRLAESEVEEE